MYQWRVATESDWFRFNVHLGQPRVQVGTPSWTFEIYFWFGVLHSSYSTRVTTAWVAWQFESAMLKQIVIHSKFIHKTFQIRCRFAQSWSDSMRWCVAIYSHECLQLFSMVLPTTLLQDAIVVSWNVIFQRPGHWTDRSTVLTVGRLIHLVEHWYLRHICHESSPQ